METKKKEKFNEVRKRRKHFDEHGTIFIHCVDEACGALLLLGK
jgi:hypothetical protein